MSKYLFHTLIAGFFILLVGCQSNPVGRPSGLFNNPSFAPQMNLAQSVQEALFRNEDPAIAQVRVETRQNTVVLSGYVKKIRQSDTAEQIARQVPGVQSVENRIIIRQ
ncbi:MAG: BON domain-containing protein [Legionella sp.]|nr:BON domain-containing protein [Legionella sp.]